MGIAIHVFFNKTDIFKQKLKSGISIKSCPDFRDFQGDEYDYNQSMNFVKCMFDEINIGNDRLLYLNEVCAKHKADTNRDCINSSQTLDVVTSGKVQNVWNKFGSNINYHWNEFELNH